MKENFVFRLPPEIYFGGGEGKKAGELVKRWGEKALLVTGKKSMQETGILEEILQSLEGAGVQCSIFDQVEPEPSLETVDRGLDLAYRERCDFVISLGGGSAQDCGKAIAGLCGNSHTVLPYFEGKVLSSPGIPWIAVPTTAGTGSEMTTNAVLTDYRTKLKKSFRSPYLLAKLVIIDPLYTRFMSPYLTATSGIDALVQALEAYVSQEVNPVSEVLAEEAIELLWKYLPQAVKEGQNLNYRKQVAKGSMISAMAFANSASGPAHGLSHIVGPEFSVVHGEACGIFFPRVVEFNREVLKDRYEKIARIVEIEGEEDLIDKFIEAFLNLMKEIGLRTSLGELGIKEDMLQGIVKGERIGRNLRENPRPMGEEEIYTLLKASL